MAHALTLHHGDQQAEYVEHPTEVARRALMAAAEVEVGWLAVEMLGSLARFQTAACITRTAPDGAAIPHQPAVPGREAQRQHQRDRVGKPPARRAPHPQRARRAVARTSRDLEEIVEMTPNTRREFVDPAGA